MNLDPFGSFSDDKIWSALEHAHMKVFVKSVAAQLDYEVGEGGQNLRFVTSFVTSFVTIICYIHLLHHCASSTDLLLACYRL